MDGSLAKCRAQSVADGGAKRRAADAAGKHRGAVERLRWRYRGFCEIVVAARKPERGQDDGGEYQPVCPSICRVRLISSMAKTIPVSVALNASAMHDTTLPSETNRRGLIDRPTTYWCRPIRFFSPRQASVLARPTRTTPFRILLAKRRRVRDHRSKDSQWEGDLSGRSCCHRVALRLFHQCSASHLHCSEWISAGEQRPPDL